MPARDIALALWVTLLWGFNFPVTKFGLVDGPPMFMMALRFTLSALLLLPFVAIPRGLMAQVALLSVTLGTAHFALGFTALAGLDAAIATIVAQTQVPLATILAWYVFGETMGWRRIAGMAIAFAGVALIAGEPRTASSLVYVLMMLGATLLWAVANIQLKRMGRFDGLAVTAWMSAFAAPQLLALSLLFEHGQAAVLTVTAWRYWLAIAYNAIVVMIISWFTWYALIQRHSVNQTAPFTLVTPVFGVLGAIVLLGEPFGWQRAIGAAITLAGLAIIVIRRPEAAEPTGPDKAR
jgi:O-acetylserine/cysteine efflux transporter